MKNLSFNKGRPYCFCILIFALLFSHPIWAAGHSSMQQQKTINGIVTDAIGPLPGVTVSIKGSAVSTTTDQDGRYTIRALTTDVLVYSYIGYKTLEIPVGSQTTINLRMQEDATTLKEVTINAGYYSVKDSERTGSIVKLSSKDIEKQPVSNVLAAMQGRMAGVNIIQNSGMPGGGFDIEIRGQNSLRLDGNSPLYIIDGVPYSSQSIGSSYTSGNMPAQNSPLNSINPGDISNIEVLKDADATAIYGSRGANGVVLITTKKGKEGKTTFSTTYSNGYRRVAHFMDLMNTSQYVAMRREAFANDGVTDYPSDAYDVNGTWDQNRNTNWQKKLLGRSASYTNVHASLSGGSAQTQFLISGNYNRETTVYPGDFDYIKANGHFSLNHSSSDQRFKVSFSSGYTAQFSNLPTVDLTRDAITLVPNAPSLYDDKGKLNWENNTFENPLAKLAGKIKGDTYDFLANLLLSYDLGKGFTVKTSLGYTDLNSDQLSLLPSTTYNPAYGLGSEVSAVFANTVNRSSWIIEPQLGWNYSLDKAKIEVLAGATFQQQNSSQLVSAGEGFASNSLIENPASANTYLILNSDETLYRYQALFGRVNLNWEGKYLLNFTGRRDGSSRFGPGRQFAAFGAVGAAWVFSLEHFIKEKISFLNFGKLRASYGTSGNDQIGDYQYLDTYSTSGYTYGGINGLTPTRLYNPDFGWETNKKLEAALELGFFNDRITTTVAWYRNRSSSQLVGIPLPGTTGFSELRANLDAEVKNSGLELSFRTVNVQSKDFSWISSFNITRTKNELLSFPGLEGSSYKNQYVVGQPINIVKVYQYTGLDPVTGSYQFKDFNGDGKFSASDDKKVLKDLSPDYYGGFQNQLRYGSVQLDFLLQFVKQENFNENFRTSMPGTMVNQHEAVTRHWQQPGDKSPYQAYSDSNANFRAASTRYSQSDAAISDASFIRLKNVSLSWDLPQNWTKNIACRLSLQGQNLLTFTPYKGIDPEFRSSGYLPPLRMITTSLQVTF